VARQSKGQVEPGMRQFRVWIRKINPGSYFVIFFFFFLRAITFMNYIISHIYIYIYIYEGI
jgi:hypothetical protein